MAKPEIEATSTTAPISPGESDISDDDAHGCTNQGHHAPVAFPFECDVVSPSAYAETTAAGEFVSGVRVSGVSDADQPPETKPESTLSRARHDEHKDESQSSFDDQFLP